MKRIFKYEIEVRDCAEIIMPVGAKILTVQVQRETPCIWALVNPDAERVMHRFRMCGTGHLVEPPDLPYIGTFQLGNGGLVFHLFDAGDGSTGN